ncbi:MAG: carbohydrate ABC transporter permease [Propionibacteriaceae bacterium]|jgi:N,N'-diacetylchitobiose transport system permease protein|nr:carbohydrate ABC transporter permease [Propionibacteriaceae bacterium]
MSTTAVAPVKKNSVSGRKRTSNILYSIVGVIVFFFSAFPVYWMISSSFMSNNKIRAATPTWFPGPGDFTLENYRTAIFDDHRAQFLPALWNSIQVTFLTLIICLVVAFLASVAVGRYFFKGRKAFIVAILIIQMIPGEAMMITYFRMMDGVHLTENVVGLMLIYLASVLPFTIWTLRGFVTSVPAELEESAMVDGCSRGKAFWKVTFPLLAPGLVSTGVFAFIQAWNEFNMALIMMTLPQNMTLPVWLRTYLLAEHGITDWGGLMAGSTLVAIPVVIFFMIVQGRMTGGLTAGAVKG